MKNLEKREVRSHALKCAHFSPQIKCVLHVRNTYTCPTWLSSTLSEVYQRF